MTPDTLQPRAPVAVGYLRVSTEDQAREDRASLAQQEHAIRELAERHRYELQHLFRDPGGSGGTAKRPGFQALLRHVREHPGGGVVLVLNDSRWGRFSNPEEATYWRIECERHGWPVRFVEGDESEDPLTRGIMRTIHSAQASAYRDQVRANARRGARGAAGDGWWVTEAPIGYRRQAYRDGCPTRVLEVGERKADDERVRLTPGPEHEQRFVQQLFVEYAKGTKSLGALARDANQWFPDRTWKRQTLGSVLRNPAYVGDVVWGRRPMNDAGTQRFDADQSRWTIRESAHTPLVDRPLFDRVQSLLNRNRKQTRATRGG